MVGEDPINHGDVILTYLANNTENRSVFKVSSMVLPEFPYQRVSPVVASPFADLTTIILNVTSE